MGGGGGGGGGGGSSAAGRRGGGGDLRVAREVGEEEERGGGGGMRKVRVCVRAPHGPGALLIVGGAVVGAAVFAWCRRQRDGGKGEGKKGAKNNGEQPVKEEALDGGVVEDEQGNAQRLHRIYENLSRDNIEVGVNGSVGKVTEGLYQIQKDDEIASSELVIESVDKYDHNSVRVRAEITTDGMVSAPVEKYDHNSDRDCANITARGMGTVCVTEDDDNSSNIIIKNEIIEDTKSAENSDESTVSLSSPDITREEHDNYNYVAQDTASAETTLMTECVIDQEQFSEEAKMSEAAELKLAEETKTTPLAETAEVKPEEEMETTPIVETAEVKPEEETVTTLMVETEPIAEAAEVKPAEETETTPIAEAAEVKPAEETETAPVAETAEVKPAEETDATPMAGAAEVKLGEEVMKENEFEQKEEKVREEPVEPVSSLAYSVPSLLKPTVKKRLVNPRWNETGMKLEEDCTNGELTKGGAAMGGDTLTMVRRTDSMAILALMFAVTIAITIVMRLYVPLQAA